MESVLRIAASVSTPLALGGLIAGVLFLVLRQLIAKDIFGRLATDATKDVVLAVINKLFYLALVAVVLGFLGYVIPKFIKGPTVSPDYVDVGLDEDKPFTQVVKSVAVTRNVTIVINPNCNQWASTAVVEKGDHSGNNIKEFLENLKDRTRGNGTSFTVKQEGSRRYEITCQ
jgi:ACR3 family arsenite efflux pump ArsB